MSVRMEPKLVSVRRAHGLPSLTGLCQLANLYSRYYQNRGRFSDGKWLRDDRRNPGDGSMSGRRDARSLVSAKTFHGPDCTG